MNAEPSRRRVRRPNARYQADASAVDGVGGGWGGLGTAAESEVMQAAGGGLHLAKSTILTELKSLFAIKHFSAQR